MHECRCRTRRLGVERHARQPPGRLAPPPRRPGYVAVVGVVVGAVVGAVVGVAVGAVAGVLAGQGWAKPTTALSPGGDCAVPNEETRIGVPAAYASIIRFLPTTRPTCPGDVGVPS